MLKKRALAWTFAWGLIFGSAVQLQAGEGLNYLGRLIGMGWSDGYHADDHRYPAAPGFNCAPSTIPAAAPLPARMYPPNPGYPARPPMMNPQPMPAPNQGQSVLNAPRAAGVPNYAPYRSW